MMSFPERSLAVALTNHRFYAACDNRSGAYLVPPTHYPLCPDLIMWWCRPFPVAKAQRWRQSASGQFHNLRHLCGKKDTAQFNFLPIGHNRVANNVKLN